MRRRQRRLRSWWRHEQQSIAAALATALHHSVQRPVPKKQEWEDAEYVASRGQKTDTRAHGGLRPALLAEPHGVERVLRHTVDQIVVAVPLVPLLDDPVPQTVDTVLEFFRSLDLPVDEQAIDVPKISTDRVSQRLVERRLPQMVEQLVDVPTVLTPTRIALQIAEQLVAMPVPQVSVSGGGHRGSLSGQGSVGEQIVDIPVPRGRGKRRVQGFLPEQSTTAQPVEQLVDIPSSRRGLYGSLPEQGTTAQTVEQIVDIPSGGVCGSGSSSAAAAADEDFTGVFRTFPHGKKSAECRAGQCGPAPARQLLHAGGSARHVVGETHSCSVGRVGAGQGRSEEGAREQEEEEEEEEEEAAEVLCATSSSFWLWISSLFSTCWTRILRSFLVCCFLLRSLGI